MALNSIAEEWDSFSAVAFRKMNPCDVQREEMKKAFFAGAWSAFSMVQEVGKLNVSEQQIAVHLEGIRCECKEFASRIMQQYQNRN